MMTKSFEDRLADAIFGNGQEGLLARVARIDERTVDTNDKVTRIDGQVAELVAYRDALPSDKRQVLVEELTEHLNHHPSVFPGLAMAKKIVAVFGAAISVLTAIATIFGAFQR